MKSRHLILWAFVLCLAASMTACGWTKRETAQEMLDGFGGDPLVSVSGKWAQNGAVNIQWGGPFGGLRVGPKFLMLVQEHNRVSGTFDNYEIIGTVNGDRVRLAAIAEGVVYYTFHLRAVPEQGTMFGKLCEGYYAEVKPHCQTITFELQAPRSTQGRPGMAQR